MAAGAKQQLLPGERVVTSNDLLTLTNYRVFRDSVASGQSRYTSITLDAVSSCGLVTNSQPILLVLGILAAVSGIALKGDAQIALLVVGVVFIIMYFATLSAIVAISSTGGERITVPARAQQRDLLLTLVNAIDQEKLAALGRIGTGQRVDLYAPPVVPPQPQPAVHGRGSHPRGTW